MKKYKIDNYIVAANSVRDAVTIVKSIQASAKDAEPHSIKFEGARIEYAESNHNTSGVDTWTTPDKINKWLERENLSAYEKYKKRGGGYDKIHIDFKYLIDGKHYAFHALRVDIGESSKFHKIENSDIDYVTQVIKKNFKHSGTLPQGLKRLDSVKDSRRINYDDDIIEVTLNGKVVFRGYAEDWLDNNFDSNFKWTGSQYEASNAKGKWVVRVIDSFRDARTISPWALSPGKRILSEDGDKATVVSVKGDRRNGYDVVVKQTPLFDGWKKEASKISEKLGIEMPFVWFFNTQKGKTIADAKQYGIDDLLK